MTTAALFALDWGTTTLRAYRLDAAGAVLERRERSAGIMTVTDGDFAAALDAAIGDWLRAEPSAALIGAGMIGSRQGWYEVPYVAVPCDSAGLAAGLGTVAAPTRPLHLVPGLLQAGDERQAPDVMRGEETQILGALARGAPDGWFLLPGTHSKWVEVEGGTIRRFRTFMTGEVFDVLRRHSILGRLMTGEEHAADAFAQGLARAETARGELLHTLFSARTLGLTGALPATSLPAYLSGLLVGAEVTAALSAGRRPVTILANERLTGLYATALRHFGIEPTTGPPDCIASGLFVIAIAAGLLGDR